MRLTAVVVGLLTAAVFFVVASPSAQAAENQEKPQSKTVVIKKGDSLSKIANKHETTYLRLFYANTKIQDPDVIYPGDKVRIPTKDEDLKKRPVPGAPAAEPAKRQRSSASTQQRTTAPQQVQSAPAEPAPAVASGSVWDRLAACESGGNWSINTGNGYYGGLQFKLSTWHSVGGSGYPHQNSRAEQIKRGKILQARSGWGQWPACTAKLGLR